MFSALVKDIDEFLTKHNGTGNPKLKADLLDLVQKAIEHGEAKDQNKISGIIVNGLKAFLGRKD